MELKSEPNSIPAERNVYPSPGHLLADFELPSVQGKTVRISDYRGRSNLVVIAAGSCQGGTGLPLARILAGRYAEPLEREALVILVLHCSPEEAQLFQQRTKVPFVVLVDEQGRVLRRLGALQNDDGPDGTAVYVTDRYGEVFAGFRTAAKQEIPNAGEILGWLDFIERQCPECFPPEWPPLAG